MIVRADKTTHDSPDPANGQDCSIKPFRDGERLRGRLRAYLRDRGALGRQTRQYSMYALLFYRACGKSTLFLRPRLSEDYPQLYSG
jgi:hypothetical protein